MSATEDRTDSMTMETYTKQTTPMSFVNTTARRVTSTPELVTGTKDNTTLVFLNVSTCLCPCKCITVISKDNSDKMMAAMLEDLIIPKFETSLSKRKLSSAPDDRISSKGIGLVGTFVMTVVFGIILIGDVKLFLLNARTAYVNLRNFYAN
ncbi:uncharacterized protein LOC132713770 [Ruditapes philippinarum]|uniref:uncharacterized protein LOC132713770 n=1 Tax=Ruditapes philippinarum TaxID=129788 RepID=UPI00295B3357|nr:uncharacterized protein LOC132713770 [Ruditapes philippinarum]